MKNVDNRTNDYKIMKKIIRTLKASQPIGPYSQAVLVNNVLYTSGQIALHPETGELVINSIDEETTQVMENLKAILEAADMTFENVIKSSIFISDMKSFEAINRVYGTYFKVATAPARETVEVANLPKFVNIEISMIAVI